MIVGGPSPRERVQRRQDAQGTRQQRLLEAEDRAAAAVERLLAAEGILPHVDPDDPWAVRELRPCEPGCEQHPKSA